MALKIGTTLRSKADGTVWRVTALETLWNAWLGREALHVTLTDDCNNAIRLADSDEDEWNDLVTVR